MTDLNSLYARNTLSTSPFTNASIAARAMSCAVWNFSCAKMLICSNFTSNPRRAKKSLPRRPTSPSDTCRPAWSVTKLPAPLITFVLKLPHNPRSAVTTMSSTRPPAFGSARSSSSGCADGSTRDARLLKTRLIWFANGRAFWMRSCARRNREAATIFIALVICCVDLTARPGAGYLGVKAFSSLCLESSFQFPATSYQLSNQSAGSGKLEAGS